MITTVFGKLFAFPFVADLIKSLVGLGYRKLKERNEIFKFLAENGIEQPEDDCRSLYIHSLILLNSQINDSDYLKVLISENSFAVFKSSYIESEDKDPFILHVNNDLLLNIGLKDSDKIYNNRSQIIVDEFIKIYNSLVIQVATPVQSSMLNSLDNLNNGSVETNQGIALILEKLEAKGDDSQFIKDQVRFANKFLEEGRINLGIEALKNLEKNLHEIKSIDVRSTLLVNLGYAYNEIGDKDEASKYFKRSYEINENNYAALCNYSQSLISEGNYSLGEKLVDKAVQLYGDKMPEVWEAYILVKQKSFGIDEIIKKLPLHFLDKAGVLRALAISCRSQGLIDRYYEYVKNAFQIAPDDSGVKLSYVESVIHQYQTDYTIYNIRSIGNDIKSEIENHIKFVEGILSSENEVTDNKLFYYQAKLIFLYLLHREDEALEYLKVVETEFSLEKRKLYQLKGLLLFINGHLEEAVSLLEKFSKNSGLEEDLVMLMDIASRSKQASLVEKSFEQLSESEDLVLVYQGILILVDYYISDDNVDKINIWAEKIKQYEGLKFQVIEAKILFYLRSPAFETFLNSIEDQISSETRFSIVNSIVELYEKAGLWEKAVLLLEKRVIELDYNSLMDRLLIAIENSGDINKLTQKLESLRVAKGIHPKYTVRECNFYIENYLYTKAIQLAKDYVNIYRDRVDMEIFIATNQFRIGDFSEIDLFLERDIEIDGLSKDNFNNYLVFLASRGKTLKCLNILYEYHRKNHSPYSNDLYLTFCLKFDLLSAVVQPNVVDQGTFVTLYDGVREKRKLLIVGEKINDLQIHRYEVSIKDNFVSVFVKQSTGYEFTIEETFISKKWHIETIESKYTYQFRECQEDAGGVFKREGNVKTFHVDDFISMLILPKEKPTEEDPVGLLFGFYDRGEVGLGTLSEAMDENPVNIRDQLLMRRNRLVASNGFKEELAWQEFNDGEQEIVIDITGILSLRDLGLLEITAGHFKNLTITHSTLEVLQDFYQVNSFGEARAKLDSNPFFTIINSHFKIKNPTTITINKHERERFNKNYGTSLYDSALLAKEARSVLYSDDLFLRSRAKDGLQLITCWTIPFLKYFKKVELIDGNFYHEKILQLISMRYRFVDVNGETLFYCLQIHNYKLSNQFIDILHMLTGKVSSLESVVNMFVIFVEKLISSEKYNQIEFFEITDLVLSYLAIERKFSELADYYESVIFVKSKTNKQYYFMQNILNRYSLQFGVKLIR